MAGALGGERSWRTVPGGHFAFFRDRRLWGQLADFMAT
jgi:hypothetical protein